MEEGDGDLGGAGVAVLVVLLLRVLHSELNGGVDGVNVTMEAVQL